MVRSKPGRPRCIRCAKLMATNSDGRFRFHMTRDGMGTCLGSYETPDQQANKTIHPVILKELDEGWHEFMVELFRRGFLVKQGDQYLFRETRDARLKALPPVVQDDITAMFKKSPKPEVKL